MRIDVITLFPAELAACVSFGVTGRALTDGVAELACWSPRDYASNRLGRIDDRPFGGGPGMVMQAQPLADVLAAARASDTRPAKLAHLSPQGVPLKQEHLNEIAQRQRVILLCGRYEGIDERFIQREVDEEWSVGDYVLSGGELAAAVMIDAVVRLLPGALGKDASAEQDSFMNGLLDCPHYSRPEVWAEQPTPAELMSGDHAAIARWRREQSLLRTLERRPELLAEVDLSDEDRQVLARAKRT